MNMIDVRYEGGQAMLPDDPVAALARAPMSGFQWFAIAVVGLLYALDGFDVMAISFSAPALLTQWGISKAELGYALSAGLFGMAIGSMLISPLADMIGRRRILLIALIIMIAGTCWTALCHGVPSLTASRFVTGVGIGAMLGVVSPLAAEYANTRRRDAAVSLTSAGYAIGAILGGLVAAWLLSAYGWRSIFIVGSGVGIAMLALCALCLAEPLALVVAVPRGDGLARANAYLRRCGRPLIGALPPAEARQEMPILALFGPGIIRNTLALTSLYFCYMIPLFYMQTWVPTLVVEMGLPSSQAALVTATMSIGGVMAGIVIAFSSAWIGLKRLEAILLGGGAVTLMMFIAMPGRLPILLPAALITGFFLMGSMVGIWTIIARTFPVHLRASGTGFVLGIGRLGSTLPPLIAGFLFAAGFDRHSVSLTMATPLIASLAFLFVLEVESPSAP